MGPHLGSLTVIVGGSWKARRAQVGTAYVFAVRRIAEGSVASGMRTQVWSKWTRWQGDAGDEGVRTTVDVEDECTLVAIAIGIGSGSSPGADDCDGAGVMGAVGAVDSDEESWLVGGGEEKGVALLLSSSYEVIFGIVWAMKRFG